MGEWGQNYDLEKVHICMCVRRVYMQYIFCVYIINREYVYVYVQALHLLTMAKLYVWIGAQVEDRTVIAKVRFEVPEPVFLRRL